MRIRALAIDPGAAGGIAWAMEDGAVGATPIPEGLTSLCGWLAHCNQFDIGTAVVEDVGYHVKGNNAQASCKFARHVGHIEACLYALGIPFEMVKPSKWQSGFGVPKAMEKQDRKRWIKERVSRMFPNLHVTLKTADALALLAWRMEKLGLTPSGIAVDLD